jgi:hypothetical protein
LGKKKTIKKHVKKKQKQKTKPKKKNKKTAATVKNLCVLEFLLYRYIYIKKRFKKKTYITLPNTYLTNNKNIIT